MPMFLTLLMETKGPKKPNKNTVINKALKLLAPPRKAPNKPTREQAIIKTRFGPKRSMAAPANRNEKIPGRESVPQIMPA